jgi:hypothetical protein
MKLASRLISAEIKMLLIPRIFALSLCMSISLSAFYVSTITSQQIPTEFVEDMSFLLPRFNNPKINETNEANHSFEIVVSQDETFSSCLLVMDENFRLYEWLSYHYHVLPLRYVVVAVDPRSHLSPEPVFDLFRKELNMTIITWADDDYIDVHEELPENATGAQIMFQYLKRQCQFLSKCLHYMQDQGRKWVALWDVDEYISINGYDRPIGNSTTPSDLFVPGTIYNYLQKMEPVICHSMIRLEVGTKEHSEFHSLYNESAALMNISISNLKPHQFDTLRYKYRNRNGGKIVGNGLGKVFLNVQNITFPWKVETPHRPVKHLCQGAYGVKYEKGPFLIYHYVGSWEAYSFRRSDARLHLRNWTTWKARSERSLHFIPKVHRWIEGFIMNVGKNRAYRLLQNAGLLNGTKTVVNVTNV